MLCPIQISRECQKILYLRKDVPLKRQKRPRKEPSYILQLLSFLYVHRSDTLWAEPEVKEWLQQTLNETVPMFADSSNADVAFGLQIWRKSLYPNNAVPQGILRHVLVSDIQSLRSLLPQSVLNSQSFAFDPLPPGPGFDDEYFKAMYDGGGKPTGRRGERNTSSGQSDREGGDFVRRLLQYLQSGGESGRGLDPDTEAAVIAQLEQFAAVRGDGMLPGVFPGMHDEEDEVDGPEPRQAGNAGIMNFFRGLWQAAPQGQPTAAETDSYEGSEDGENRHTNTL